MGEKWLPFAAQAFTEAAIRRQQAEQFGDPFQSEAEKRRLSELKRPEPLTMKQGASGMRYLSHEETTALQNKERNLTHSREFLRRGWTQQSFCRVVRGMDFAYNARQAKSIRRAGDRDEGEVLGADSKSASRAKELEEKLRKSTFFKDMERQKKGIIHKLAKVSKVRGENAGQVVFRQGDQDLEAPVAKWPNLRVGSVSRKEALERAALLLNCLLAKVQAAYLDCLAEADPQTLGAVPLMVVEHWRFDTASDGVAEARLRALDAALAHRGWGHGAVQELQRAEYAKRSSDGWRASPGPRSGQPAEKQARLLELVGKLHGRRLMTEGAPDLNRRLHAATEAQVISCLRKLSLEDRRNLINADCQSAETTAKRLEQVFALLHEKANPLPEVEREVRAILTNLAQVHAPRFRALKGCCLRGLRLGAHGSVDFFVQEVPFGVPSELFAQLLREVLGLPRVVFQGSFFYSLDKAPVLEEAGFLRSEVLQQQRHPFGLHASEVVRLLHHCDYLMKEMSQGTELNALSFQCRPLHLGLPGYLAEMLKPAHQRGPFKRSMDRLWLETQDIFFKRNESGDDEEVFMDTPSIRVRAHPLEYDEGGAHRDALEEAPPGCTAAEFAMDMTLSMEALANYFPEFRWLAEVPKMQRLVRELEGHKTWLTKKLAISRQRFSEQCESLREQIPVWPHRARGRQEILDDLCRQNPHATRSEVECHHVFHTAVKEAPEAARRQDNHVLSQLEKIFWEASGCHTGISCRADRNSLRPAIVDWLNTGQEQRLRDLMCQQQHLVLSNFQKTLDSLGCNFDGGFELFTVCMVEWIWDHLGKRGGPRDPDDPEKRRLLGLFLESGRGGAQGGSRYTAADASGAQVRSFEDLRKADPKLHYSFRYRGGWKSVSEAEALYEKVPSDVRAQGPDAVKSYLASRDASHIKARASGGPNTAENLEFECRNLNRQRNYDFRAGRRETPHMTPEELQAVRRANGSVQVLEVQGMTSRMASVARQGGAVGAVVEGALSVLEDGVEYRRGQIDGQQYAQRVATKTLMTIGAAVSGAAACAGAGLAALAPVLAAPVGVGLAVYGAVVGLERASKAIADHLKLKKEKASVGIGAGGCVSGLVGAGEQQAPSGERAAASWKVKMNFAAPEKAEVKRLEPREDEAGRPVYATVEGFNCFREDSDLGPQVNALESGAVFGEVSLLSDAPRSASVRCLEDCELLVVNAVAFRKVLAEFVDVARACGALQSVDFFNKLEETTPGIIHTLAKSSEFLTELKGQVIFRQNDPGKCCFILVKGQVTVHMREGRKARAMRRPAHTADEGRGDAHADRLEEETGLEAFDETARSEEKRNGKQPRPAQSFRTSEGFSTFSKESNYGKMLRFLREVSLFGAWGLELALQNTEPRSASIVCSQDSEFLRLRKEDFLAAIQGRKQKIYFFDEHIEALKDFADKKAQGALLQHPSLLFTDEIYRDGQPITTEGVYANSKVYLVGAGAKVDLCRYKEPCASPAYFLARRPRSAPKKSKGPCLRMLPDNLEPCPAEEALQQSAGIFNPNEEDMDLYGTLQEGSLFGTAGALQNHSPEPFSAVARCETETCTIYALDSAGMQQLHPKLLAVLREMVAEGSLERLQQLPAPPNAWQERRSKRRSGRRRRLRCSTGRGRLRARAGGDDGHAPRGFFHAIG
ncbi:unnamed protein product [Effrenium voratum]|nr:unnamed protein product [Effrenium voratum]